MKLLPGKLHELRTEKRYTRRSIAKAIGVGESMYCRMEKGERALQPHQIDSFASFLKVDAKELHALWLADRCTDSVGETPQDVVEQAISVLSQTQCPK